MPRPRKPTYATPSTPEKRGRMGNTPYSGKNGGAPKAAFKTSRKRFQAYGGSCRGRNPSDSSGDEPRWISLTSFGDAARAWLTAKGGDPLRAHLEQLWKNWEMVMGPDIAPLAHPLGHRDGLLLVGADDHLLMQELTYSAPEILERVNAFMGEDFFRKVEFHLLFEKTPLNLTRPTQVPPPPPPPRPERLGELALDPESPVGRCYKAYLQLFGGKKTS